METLSFGTCPICGQGELIAVKSIATQELLIMCDDCESQWRSPSDSQSYENALTDEYRDLESATYEEIEAQGWLAKN